MCSRNSREAALNTVMTDDAQKLAGDWKLVSFFTEDVQNKQRTNVYGEHPSGYIGISPAGRFFGLIAPDVQNAPRTTEEQAAAYRGMLAYTGKLKLDGEKFIVEVDVAWNKDWVGTEQVRFWRLEGDKLRITSAPIPNPNVAGSMIIGTLVWQREH
jgi:lipocalin-like protein